MDRTRSAQSVLQRLAKAAGQYWRLRIAPGADQPMKGRIAPLVRLMSFAILGAIVAGCATAHSIPYASGGRRADQLLSGRKSDTPLAIRMRGELQKQVVEIKPGFPGAAAYRFFVGESIRANLVNTLGAQFRSVDVSTLSVEELTGRGAVLDVDLKSHDFQIPMSIFGTPTTRLGLEYGFYYDGGKKLFTIQTETTGTAGMSGEPFEIRKTTADWGRFPVPEGMSQVEPFLHAVGRSYDVALAKSIDELLIKLNETLLRHGQGQ